MMFGNCEDNSYELRNDQIRSDAAAYREDKLRVDQRRLDFLNADGTKHVYAVAGVWFFRPSEDAMPVRMPNVRAAIDAAIAKATPQGAADHA